MSYLGTAMGLCLVYDLVERWRVWRERRAAEVELREAAALLATERRCGRSVDLAVDLVVDARDRMERATWPV